MNNDTLTTIVGVTGAVVNAVTPITNAVQGSLHQQDYISIVISALMAVFAYFTNKKSAPKVED